VELRHECAKIVAILGQLTDDRPSRWKLYIGDRSLGLFEKLRAVLNRPTADPPDARKLAASSENELAASLHTLPVGEKGWITLHDAWRLFSRVDEEYGFGEMDDDGKWRLEEFAASHHSMVDFMPVEGRVYFTRR